jgi:hypothetical protein
MFYIKRFALALVLMTTLVSEAPAQFQDGCNPYNYDGCTPVLDQHRFTNVLVNAPGIEWAFVSVHNTSAFVAEVIIKVTLPGRPVRTFTRHYKGDKALLPGELLQPELISLWPELRGYSGGVSVVIASSQTVMGSVAMHPKIDIDAPDLPGQIVTYWRYAKFLEGR